jgi:hypothetical protein
VEEVVQIDMVEVIVEAEAVVAVAVIVEVIIGILARVVEVEEVVVADFI